MTYLLHQLLGEAAAGHPEREALACKGRSMTYAELEAAANGIANALLAAGVRPGDRVGIFVPKDLEMMAAVNGALKAGACFVPLDPMAPPPRVAAMVEDSTVSALVATPARAVELFESLERHRPGVVLLVDDGSGPADLPVPTIGYTDATSDPGASDPGVHGTELDLSCIAYTSGSTGAPKGVTHNHRSLLTAAEWFATRMRLSPEDRLVVHSPLHFLISGYSLWAAARVGAAAVLMAENEVGWGSEIARVIRDERITIWFSVNSALTLLLQTEPTPGSFPSLRIVAFGGAAFAEEDMRKLKKVVPDVEFVYFLGTTETWGNTTYHFRELPEEWPLPVGKALENVQVFLLKDDGGVAGPGEEGEMYVRTPSLMRGYWGQPEMTAEKVVPNPIDPHLPDPVYRTGDVARLRPDGNHVFVGRRDLQIKTRGYRVEPEEVERAISSHPAVKEVTVVAVAHPEWGKAIVAMVAPREEGALSVAEVKAQVADRLPLYMVPATVHIVEELPRTSSGKIDRPRIQSDMERAAASGQ